MSKWNSVTHESPCPICEKPDWCRTTSHGLLVCCKRKESNWHSKNGGYLHWIGGGQFQGSCSSTYSLDSVPDTLDNLQDEFQSAFELGKFALLASMLNLSEESLQRLGIGWSNQNRAWTFPMRDACGTIIGFRTRTQNGKKFAIKGSKSGLFIPDGLTGDVLLIAEGPTDTAALLDLGFDAIGRPSCRGGVKHIIRYVRRTCPTSVVVVSDNDGPGIAGAETLVHKLCLHVRDLRLLKPPLGIKDARQWKARGATHETMYQAIAESEQVRVVLKNEFPTRKAN